MLNVRDLVFSYPGASEKAVNGISFSIKKGEYAVILGSNGSGKSTLARLLTGFLTPVSGSIEYEDGVSNGIVFQAPKEQIVSGIVCRDTEFGPENLGLPRDEIEQRAIESLSVTGLLDRALSSTNALSLGQTQKLALSGIIALRSDLLVLDEATSMLDPESRKDVLDFIDSCNGRGQTILHITHDFEEALKADHIIAIDKGRIIFDGNNETFRAHGEIVDRLFGEAIEKCDRTAVSFESDTVFEMKGVSYSYDEKNVIENFNMSLKKGSLTALTGPSGSGKSTVLELAAGLLSAKEGGIFCANRPALALQDSQASLFEAFAADDVAFGPRNLGMKGKKLKATVKESMETAGLPFEKFADRATFMLSGGEKRKLSIAGIIAMNSDVILFDEPTAGLDPKSRRSLMHSFKKLAESGKTVMFSTHRMDEAAFADRHIAMENGKIVSDSALLTNANSELPQIQPRPGITLLEKLKKTRFFAENVALHKKNVLQFVAPVPKYLIFLVIFSLSLIFSNPVLAGGMVAVSIFYGFLARYPIRKFFMTFAYVIPWILFFCAFQLVLSIPSENDVIYFQFGWFTVTLSKLILCLTLVLHTFSAFCAVRVFVYSTGEREFLEGLSGLLLPLKLIKIPTRSFIVIVEIIFRFIPLLIEESCSIVKTQLVRGALGNAKTLIARIKIILPLFIPLIIQTVKRSESLADALTARKL